MIRIVIADDQGMVRRGLVSLLGMEPDFEVVGEAADGEEAVRLVKDLKPDVAMFDIRMPVLDGISAMRQVAATKLPVKMIALTTFDLDEYVFEALRAGASGFLLKDATAEDLADAVRLVHSGEAVLAPTVTRRVIDAFAANSPARLASNRLDVLSPRELDVLRLLARGRSNAEIAAELYLSAATVKTHVSAILAKLDLRDRVHAAIAAYETGLVRPGE